MAVAWRRVDQYGQCGINPSPGGLTSGDVASWPGAVAAGNPPGSWSLLLNWDTGPLAPFGL